MGIDETPKQDLIDYRIAKAYEVYKEAEDVASLHHWNLTVNRLYYSIFHIASALILSVGSSARTHKGILIFLMKDYVRTGKLTKEEGQLISSLFNMRHTGDYDDLFDYGQNDVEPLMEPTKALIEKLRSFISISNP